MGGPVPGGATNTEQPSQPWTVRCAQLESPAGSPTSPGREDHRTREWETGHQPQHPGEPVEDVRAGDRREGVATARKGELFPTVGTANRGTPGSTPAHPLRTMADPGHRPKC